MAIRILHSADTHFSINPDMLAEVIRTTDFMLQQAAADPPDVIVLAGDTVDEYMGRIRIDSECARAAISFVERCGNIAPTVIIRGTRSHDREAVYLFQHLRSKFPIHVACDVQQVALVPGDVPGIPRFVDLVGDKNYGDVECVFTLVPSLDKTFLMAEATSGISDGNQLFRSAVHDLFAGFGVINDSFTDAGVPTVLVTHGMATGSVFSSGQTAIGEDLEFSVGDLQAARASATMLGHVHRHQIFPGNVVYCGSPGRLNFGEPETKGFVMWQFDGAAVTDMRFIETPARRFCFGEVAEYAGADDVYSQAQALALDCRGADVRFRLSVPEENRGDIDRDRLEQIFLAAGANKVKIELSVIPRQRARAEGISRLDLLPAKVVRWGETVGEDIPAAVLALASIIEGQSVEELLVQAQVNCEVSVVVPMPVVSVVDHTVVSSRLVGVAAACNRYLDAPGGQPGLFGGK